MLYDLEMENISKRFAPNKENLELSSEAIHVMNLFTFHNTTPANRVRDYVEESFFSSSKDGSISLLTNKGVKSSTVVRLAARDMPFLTDTPLLSEDIAKAAKDFVRRLQEAGIIRPAGWEDVEKELNGRTISEIHACQLLRWLLLEKLSPDLQKRILSLAVVIVGDEKNGKVVNLGGVTSFVVPGRIPVDGGLPLSVLPLEIGKTFSSRELESLYDRCPDSTDDIGDGPNLVFRSGSSIYARRQQRPHHLISRKALNLQLQYSLRAARIGIQYHRTSAITSSRYCHKRNACQQSKRGS